MVFFVAVTILRVCACASIISNGLAQDCAWLLSWSVFEFKGFGWINRFFPVQFGLCLSGTDFRHGIGIRDQVKLESEIK